MRLAALSFLNKGHERSVLVKKNIFYTAFLKAGSVLITLLLVPLTINYVDTIQYGIWLTISSLVYWVNMFDFGIGNGLKNEIAYSLAVNDETNLRRYVSTSYAALGSISVFMFMLFFVLGRMIDWNRLLNVPHIAGLDLFPVLATLVMIFCIQFVAQILDAVLGATQQTFKSSLILFIGQLAGLIAIYILTLTVKGDLLILVVAFGGCSALALVIASVILYRKKFKRFSPSFKYVDKSVVKKLMSVGGVFFIIQINAVLLIHSNNFIISKILGPQAVTTYNIPFRLFSFISMLFAIIIMPYWSAFTDAYARADFSWIKTNIRYLRMFCVSLVLIGAVILLFSNWIYRLWIGNAVIVPFSLSVGMLVYIATYMWHTLHVYFLNGTGKIRVQLLVGICGVLLNIPLAFILGKQFGLVGIIYSNSFTFLIMGLIYTFQYGKIVNSADKGIWAK